MRQRLAALGLARGGANGDFAALVSGDKRQQSRRRQTTVQRQLGGLFKYAPFFCTGTMAPNMSQFGLFASPTIVEAVKKIKIKYI